LLAGRKTNRNRRTSIVTGVFVQILVTADTLPQVSASA